MADSVQTEEISNISPEESNLQGAEGYQLWSAWTPLDESFQWIRHPITRPSRDPSTSFVSFSETPTDKEVQHYLRRITVARDGILWDRNESSNFSPTSQSPKLPRITEHCTADDTKNSLMKPQPVRLNGVDSVFGRVITAQPPKWTGVVRFSEKSAFCKIINPGQEWPTGLKESQSKMVLSMCKQMLRASLLLHSTYKKCTFILQHSR
ncbi:FANCD2 opposite strand protein [Tachyglossus aculeatus]|uniref:FANCD2 opposite strand protein n=1 Tax=Tachyglossus aculeatus TaxID=9261 RepID=UPI0018F416D6|nr:FANCD2 opposite strand protein [Tachyglossus aculeatus]